MKFFKRAGRRLKEEFTVDELEQVKSDVSHRGLEFHVKEKSLKKKIANTRHKTDACKAEIIASIDTMNAQRALYHEAVVQLNSQLENMRKYKKSMVTFIEQLGLQDKKESEAYEEVAGLINSKKKEMESVESLFKTVYANLLSRHSNLSAIFGSPEYGRLLQKYLPLLQSLNSKNKRV